MEFSHVTRNLGFNLSGLETDQLMTTVAINELRKFMEITDDRFVS